jgi:hypothetical protein
MTDVVAKRKKLSEKWLKKWEHGSAKIWSYSVSHRVLVIKVFPPEGSGNLAIYCGDTQYLRGPVEWSPAELRLDVLSTVAEENAYRLSDDKAGFEVLCGLVEMAENLKK